MRLMRLALTLACCTATLIARSAASETANPAQDTTTDREVSGPMPEGSAAAPRVQKAHDPIDGVEVRAPSQASEAEDPEALYGWAGLQLELGSGARVRVDLGRRMLTGSVERVTPESLFLRQSGRRMAVEVPRFEIRGLDKSMGRRTGARKGGTIGAITVGTTGALFGVFVAAHGAGANCEAGGDCDGPGASGFLLGAGVGGMGALAGAGVGAAIGSGFQSETWAPVYARRAVPRVTVSPVRHGVAASLSWRS